MGSAETEPCALIIALRATTSAEVRSDPVRALTIVPASMVRVAPNNDHNPQVHRSCLPSMLWFAYVS